MEASELTLVSAADQLVEPPTLFADHFPAGLADRAPRLVEGARGTLTWVVEGVELGVPGAGLRTVRLPGPGEGPPAGYESLSPALYDVNARVAAMDVNGVFAAPNFPTLGGLAGARLHEVADPALAAAVVSAYNDWQLDGWAAAAPGRLIPLGRLPVWDLDAAVAEVKRVSARGMTVLAFPDMPHSAGLPSFSTDHWDPLLRAVSDAGVALCLEKAQVAETLDRPDLDERPADAPFNPFAAQAELVAPQLAATVCTDLIVSGVLNRFPTLRIVTSQGGIGWIPFLLDRIDHHIENQVWLGLDLGGGTGTDVFRAHFVSSFVTDPSSLYLRDRIGIESIAWQSAFPSTDSTWPSSPELLASELAAAGIDDEEAGAITWRNASRVFGFDPFRSVDSARATVGALRAQAAGAGAG
jgi:predicted TIM-barrel fold metal-dependent hydrolase